jgi:hypothetical protein
MTKRLDPESLRTLADKLDGREPRPSDIKLAVYALNRFATLLDVIEVEATERVWPS